MAYQAEIQIGVKGAKELQGLTNRIKDASNAVQGLNDFVENLSGSVPKTFDNIASAVQDARRAFNESVSSTREATQAAYALVQAEAAYNAELKERNELLSRVRASQGPSIRGQRLTETQQQGQESFQQFFADAQEQAKGISINATNIRTAWSTFFSDAEQLALDLQTSTSAEQAQIKRNWAVFFGDAAEVASDLQNATNARNAQIKLSWNKFFGDAAEVASDLQTATTARAGTVKQSWTRFFADAAEVASELQTTAKARSNQLNRNWNTFFADAAEVAQDLQASSSAKKLNVKTSWVKFFSDAEELANELRATAATKEAKIKLSWGKFFNEADTVARDLRLAAQTDKVRIQRSWATFFDDAERLALDLGKEARDARAVRARRTKDAVSSGIIGGAFPLLFGQGAGASVGGAVGGVAGGLVGGQFGFGLSLVGTQLGTIFDTLVTKAGTLANSLNTTGEILSGLEEAGFKVSDATKSVIASYEEAGLLSDAYALALGEVNRVLGPGGVEKLDAYKTETQKLNDEFEKVSGALQSELIPALTGLLRIILGAKTAFDDFANSPLGQIFLKGAKELAFNAPGGGGLRGASFAIGALQAVGAPTGPAEKPTAQRLAEEAVTLTKLSNQQKLNKAAREERYLVAAQINLARVGSDILKEEVVAAKKKVIQETFLAAVRKEGITPQQVLLAGDRKRLATAQLEREISEANLKLAEQKTNKLKKQTNELKKQEALQRKIKDAQISARLAQDIFAAQPLVDPTPFSRLTPEQKRQSALDLQRIKYTADKDKIENSITNEKIKQSKLDEAEANNNLALLNINNDYTNTIKRRNEDYLTQTRQLQTQLNIITATTRQEAERLRLEQEFQVLQDSNQFSPEQLQQIKLQKEGILEAQQPLNRFITDSTKALNDLEQVAVDVSQGIGSAVGNALTFGVDGLVAGTKSAQEVFADFLKNIAQLLLKTAAQMIATYIAIGVARLFAGVPAAGKGSAGVPGLEPNSYFGTGGQYGSFVPPAPRANGGPVKSGNPYIIGERGPELFVPRSSGRVVPNGRFGGGGGGDVNVVVNVDAKGSNAQGSDRDAKTLGAAIGVAVRSELVKQKRPGGLLAS